MNIPRILLVEDCLDFRAALAYILSGEGFRVDEAGDGLEALNVLRDRPLPALIISDIQMPNMDGIEFLDIIKKEKNLSDIPVLVVSLDDRVPALCDRLGIKDFTNKNLVRVMAIVLQLLKAKGVLKNS